MVSQEQLEMIKEGFATVAWFPVFTLLIGYVMKSVSDLLQHRRTLERDREARESTRREQITERRANFQRQTLLDLQEVLFQLARNTGAMHHQDLMAHRKTGKWQRQLFPDDLDEGSRLSMARTSMLAVRVRDASVRQLVQVLRENSCKVTMSTSLDESESAMGNMISVFEEVNQRIGELLRKIDEETEQ